MEHPKERDWKSSFSGALGNDKQLKDPRNVAIAFNNLFITIIEKFNIQQIEKGDAISILKDSFRGYIPCIQIIPISEAEVKSIIHSLKQKISCYDNITSKI
jgi:translation initiation factor 1 (eIF-1/SUI1)